MSQAKKKNESNWKIIRLFCFMWPELHLALIHWQLHSNNEQDGMMQQWRQVNGFNRKAFSENIKEVFCLLVDLLFFFPFLCHYCGIAAEHKRKNCLQEMALFAAVVRRCVWNNAIPFNKSQKNRCFFCSYCCRFFVVVYELRLCAVKMPTVRFSLNRQLHWKRGGKSIHWVDWDYKEKYNDPTDPRFTTQINRNCVNAKWKIIFNIWIM